MKRLVAIFILICLLSNVGKSQIWADEFLTRNAYGLRLLSLDLIQGSPFLDKEYKPGVVTTSDGKVYKDVPLRYNCFNDVFEFLKEGISYEVMPKEKVKRVELEGKVFRYMDCEFGKSKKANLAILAEGKATLCAHYAIKFYEEEPLKGYAEPVRARFDDFKQTFLISINEAPAKLITNNKRLIEILGDKKSDIQSYMSKQKLGVKKAEDLKKIINYYNSL